MQNENQPQQQLQLSLTDLGERIRKLAVSIDEACDSAVAQGLRAAAMAFELGDCLAMAKHICKHGEFVRWVEENTPVGPRQAQKYLALSEVPKANRDSYLQDAKSVNGLFRMLGVITPEPPKQIDMPTISIPPEVRRLTWIGEWFAGHASDIEKLEPNTKAELKAKLRPVVEVYERL